MGTELKEIVYTPRAKITELKVLFRDLRDDLKACRYLAWRLFIRNLSAQHRQSILGYVWLLVPPIVMTVIWVFLNSQNIIQVEKTQTPYPIFVLSGTILWQGFVEALNSPLQMVQEARGMLTKVKFPHESLILAGAGNVLFNMVIRLAVLTPALFYFDISFHLSVIWVPVGVLCLICLGLMFGLLVLPLSLLYSDIHRLVNVFAGLWFFVTPIIYAPPSNGFAGLVSILNPVSPLLIATRNWMLGAEVNNLLSFTIVSVISAFLIVLGWFVYRVAMPHLIERIGS